MRRFLRQTSVVLDTIKFQHSVFALPFALTAALLALRNSGLGSTEAVEKLAWLVTAMVAARSAAMAFNRLVDTAIDARNPRTSSRALPAGKLSKRFAAGFVVCSCLLFAAAAGQLNPLCLKLSPIALAVVLGYSYTKRFTPLAHMVLGASLGIAPAAAWIAIRGTLDTSILALSAAVMLWTAGFDIIYSCQDTEFDRTERLHSLPAWIGIGPALVVSRLLHVAMVILLLAAWYAHGLGWAALAGVILVGALLTYEQSLVSADDLTRVNAAFFAVNGWVSVLFLVFWATDLWLASTQT